MPRWNLRWRGWGRNGLEFGGWTVRIACQSDRIRPDFPFYAWLALMRDCIIYTPTNRAYIIIGREFLRFLTKNLTFCLTYTLNSDKILAWINSQSALFQSTRLAPTNTLWTTRKVATSTLWLSRPWTVPALGLDATLSRSGNIWVLEVFIWRLGDALNYCHAAFSKIPILPSQTTTVVRFRGVLKAEVIPEKPHILLE